MCYQTTPFPGAETDLLVLHRIADEGRSNLLQGLGWFMLKYVCVEACEIFGGGREGEGIPHKRIYECMYNMHVCS